MNWATILAGLAPAIISQLPTLLNTTHPAVTSTQAIAAQPAVDVAFVKLVQTVLNEAQSLGFVTFGAALTVDGIAGAKTTAAFQAVLAKLGIAA